MSTLSISLRGQQISFEELVGLLLQEEQTRINFGEQEDQAFFTKGKGKGKWKGKPSSSKDQKSKEAQDQGSKKKGKCHYCKKFGHHIKECRKKLTKDKEKGIDINTAMISLEHQKEMILSMVILFLSLTISFLIKMRFLPLLDLLVF